MSIRSSAPALVGIGVVCIATSSLLATEPPPPRPPGPAPAIQRPRVPAIPKVDPVLNRLYRERFGGGQPVLSVRSTDHGPVSIVVERAEGPAAEVVSHIKTLGGSVDRVYRNLVFAELALEQLPLLVLSDDVLRVRRPYRSEPDVVSEGVVLHNADTLHTAGLTGDGVKVGVLDCGGFMGYAGLLGTELPPTVTLWTGGADPIGSDDHGTACAEIVHDVAPGAELYFAHNDGEAEFYAAADWFTAQQVDVVSYSCSWIIPAPHDGAGLPHNPVNDKVSELRSAGILWVNSAGNYAYDDTYQGAFQDAGPDNWHNFDDYWANAWWLLAGRSLLSVLCWNDWPVDPGVSGASNNYDLYLYWWDGANWQQMDQSNNPQNGNPGELPCEEIDFTAPADEWYWLGVWRENADGNQFLDLRTESSSAFSVSSPEHSISIPSESPDVLAVGAVHWSSLALEPFSSCGPTLGPGGAPTGGLLKPDLVAADAVSTVTYGPSDGQPWLSGTGFFGTSASCPHVAGGAALLLEATPGIGPGALEAQLLGSAIDMGPAGPDTEFGAGRMFLELSLIFADGFETGDTTAWSSTSP